MLKFSKINVQLSKAYFEAELNFTETFASKDFEECTALCYSHTDTIGEIIKPAFLRPSQLQQNKIPR